MSNSPKIERKLAAIMFTDIAGYTALSAKDSQKALQLLEKQNEIVKSILEIHKGNLLKKMGDGLLITFESATSAVECAIDIQKQTKDIDELNLRIGVHEGEVTIKDGDVFGDDVNIASRIEPFSAIGGLAVSHKIQQAISSNKDFETEYIGKPKLKGVSQAVEVYCIVSHQLPKTEISQVSAKLEKEKSKYNIFTLTGGILTAIGIGFWLYISVFDVSFAEDSEVPSVAILPLDNKGAEEDDFYAYGISSDLISDVSSAGLIRVAGLNDIEKLDYKNLKYQELSKKLFVRYITTGNIWKKDSIFQLSMELYDTKMEKVLWSERWQKNWNELPVIRDILAENILEKLKVNYNNEVPSYAVNPDAYEYYLKAKYKYDKRKTIEDTEVVRGLLNKAMELDGNLIAAKHLLGVTYDDIGYYDKALEIYTSALKQAEQLGDKSMAATCLGNIGYLYYNQYLIDKALDHLKKALSIFEELGDKKGISKSLHGLGAVYDYKNEDEKALDYFQKAFGIYEELGQKNGMALSLMSIGVMHSELGNYDKALDDYKRALLIAEEIDKKSSIGLILRNMGIEYNNKREYEKALEYYSRSLIIFEELGRKGKITHLISLIGGAYYNKGDYDKTLDYYEKALAIREKIGDKSGIGFSLASIGHIYYSQGDYDTALEYYEKALTIREEIGDKRLIKYGLDNIGFFHYSQGDYDKSKEYLEKSFSLNGELGFDLGLTFLTYLSLTNKKLEIDYDEKEIHILIKEAENIEYELNLRLYKLLEDKSYLETAYNQIQEKVDAMDDELKEKFLTYPIPKQIIEEYNKVYS